MTPSSGIIAVGGRENIVISFIPESGASRRSAVSWRCPLSLRSLKEPAMRSQVQIPLRIQMSDRSPVIKCRGASLPVEVDILPGRVRLGPVLPYLESKPVEIKLVNESDIDVELYSLDFDRQYLEEVRSGSGSGSPTPCAMV